MDSADRITKDHARLMTAPLQHMYEVFVANTTPNPKWLALLKTAALTLQHGGFATNMVQRGSALLQGVIQLLKLVGSAESMVQMGSALLRIAPRSSMKEEGVASMAVAGRNCAK